MNVDGPGELTLLLQNVKYDTGIADRAFDPPGATENLDVAALLREVERNQDEIEKRVSEYAFRQTETDHEIMSKGELKKETIKVYEVYPLPNREPVEKLISENGVHLSPERAGKGRREGLQD
jgi:DNA polymerase I-like protein with 3'-5' exonuclease and polymerase domains